jgi:AhpC/TSA family protein
MRRLFGLVLAAVILTQPLSRAADKEPGSVMPKVGDMAPDFALKYVDSSGMHDVSLNQYRGKKQVVLAFYVFAFTGG